MNLPHTLKLFERLIEKDERGTPHERLVETGAVVAMVEDFGKEAAKREYGFDVNSSLRAFVITNVPVGSVVEFDGVKYRVARSIRAFRGKLVHHYELLLEEM